MTINRTTLLDFPLPVTGTESGTWGDVTNNGLTQYLDIAIAGRTALTSANFTAGALTISTTEGTSSATNIAAGSAQYATISVSSLAANSTITAPSSNRAYRIINADSIYTLTIKASGQTGVTFPVGTSGLVAFNGTDYQIIGTYTTLFNVDNLKLDGNTISSTDTNGNIVLAPNGTGDVQVDADTLRVGDSNANATLTTNGTGDLIINTNAGTNSGSITIANGANGNITVAPNGTGDVYVDADTLRVGDSNANATITTNGTGDLIINTNSGTNSGSITIANGANGNITVAPNGTGDVYVDADTLRVGDSNANATITTNGTGDLILNTNAGTNSGSITIQDAANGNIILAPNGTGRVEVSGTSSNAGGINFYEDTDNGTNKALLTAAASLASDVTLTLPSTTSTLGYQNLPAVGTKTGSYTLATGDVGKYVQVGSGGSITIPDATFAEGDVISIFNNTSGAITITCSITTAYIAGTDSDKATMSLATRGVATVVFISSTVCVVTGSVS